MMAVSEQRTIRVPAADLPVVDEADVVVVGGGSSGFVAATASARTGARTILLERFGYLGGCTTTPYNTTIGLFFDSDGNQIIRGNPLGVRRADEGVRRGLRHETPFPADLAARHQDDSPRHDHRGGCQSLLL